MGRGPISTTYKFLWLAAISCVPVFAGTIDDGAGYDANSSLQLDWAQAVMQHVPLEGDERVLDIGSGTGRNSERLAASVPAGAVVGLDLSADMIRFASEHHRAANLFFATGDLCTAPYVEQFDLATAFCSLIWIEDQRAALEGIRQSLIPGGLFVAVQPAANPRNLSPVAERLTATEPWSHLLPEFRPQRFYLSRNECLDLLAEVGLEPVFVEESLTWEYYPSMEAFLDWLRPLTAFSSHFPAPIREAFLLEMAAEMVDVDERGVWLPDSKLEVIARRPVQ